VSARAAKALKKPKVSPSQPTSVCNTCNIKKRPLWVFFVLNNEFGLMVCFINIFDISNKIS